MNEPNDSMPTDEVETESGLGIEDDDSDVVSLVFDAQHKDATDGRVWQQISITDESCTTALEVRGSPSMPDYKRGRNRGTLVRTIACVDGQIVQSMVWLPEVDIADLAREPPPRIDRSESKS